MSEDEAIKQALVANADFLAHQPTLDYAVAEMKDPIQSSPSVLRMMAAKVYSRAQARRKRHDCEFLTREQFNRIWDRARGRCELTGIPFSTDGRTDEWFKNPWGPSLDRRDSRIGYTFDNCRLVCIAANIALNEFGEKVLHRVAQGLITMRRTKRRSMTLVERLDELDAA